MNVNIFSKIFSKLRSEYSLTQDEIAKKLGVSKSTIGMWEIGKRLPSPELYEAIADYFNVDIDYLYGRTDIRQKIHYDKDGTAYVPLDSSQKADLDDLPADDPKPAALRLDEQALLLNYNKLNTLGKGKLQEDAEDMTQISKYTEADASDPAGLREREA